MRRAVAVVTPVEMLRRLVAHDTVSAKSNLGLIEDVARYLAGHGVSSRVVHDQTGTKANLFATIGPAIDGGVVLSGHTDVVPVDGQPWTSPPFVLTERDGRLYGRGTADMKGFIATVLALVPEFLERPPRVPVHLCLSFDEEVGCLGIPALIRQLGKELPRPRMVIVGEPTGMKVVNAHKGINACLTIVTGKDGHSSLPHLGLNAISAAGEVLRVLDDLAAELRVTPAMGGIDVDPPWTTLNVGRIEGGVAVNIIPRECRVAWEMRPVPGFDPLPVLDRFEDYLRGDLSPRLKARCDGAGAENRILCAVPALTPGAQSPAETLGLALTGQNRSLAVAYASEAGLFQQAGIHAIVCGPGNIEQAHQPDEYVSLEQLESCARFLRRLIDWAGAR